MADDDARDERLGRLLEVEPLDEVARRRLVSTAMRATGEPAATRSGVHAGGRFVAAASVVAILVVGIGYLALRGDDGTAPNASSPRPQTTTAPVAGSSDRVAPTTQAPSDSTSDSGAGSESADQPKAASAGPRGLGDVGNLEVAANLDRLRASITGEAFSTASGNEAAGDSASLVGRLRALSCAAELPEGAIVAIGTGRFGTRDAIVVATTGADGTTSLDALVTHPCEVRPLD
jgi:hypothetical protein